MVGVCTDTGNLRKVNEDYVDYFECSSFKIYVVADGMGGHNAGEIASREAARGIIQYIKENYGKDSKESILENSLNKVNHDIFIQSLKDEELSGMGTTVTALFIYDDVLQIANVGDSGCYAINGDSIKKITKDHSLVQELIDSGTITESEAETYPHRNVITRAIGTSNNVKVDIFNIDKDFEYLLLCSDGLTNELKSNDIIDVFKSGTSLNDICKKLVMAAKDKGGKDNITALIYGGEK